MSEHSFPAGCSKRPLARRSAVDGIFGFLANVSASAPKRFLPDAARPAGSVLVAGVFLAVAFFAGAGTAWAQTPPAPTFGSASVDLNFKVGEAETETLPAASGGVVCNTYTISPQPGDGLQFNGPGNCPFGSDGVTHVNPTSGGTISGTPTAAKIRTKYVLTVTDGTLPTGREDTLDVWITVAAQDPVAPSPDPDPAPSPREPDPAPQAPPPTEEPPPVVDLMPEFVPNTFSAQNYEQDTRIAPVTLPEARGGDAPLRYALSPDLPEGLAFDEATRVISGTPTEVISETVYTLTATDSDGDSATLTFTISVEPGVRADRERLKGINTVVLPEVARAMTSSALGAVTGRIEDATSGRAAGGLAARAPVSGFSGVPVGNALEDPPRFSREYLGDLSFAVSLAGGVDDFPADGKGSDGKGSEEPGRIAVWAVGDYGRLSGKQSMIDWKGGLFAGHLGTDVRLGRDFIIGVAASWFEGSFDYTDGRQRRGGGETAIGGEIEGRMTGFYPYMSWSLTEAFSMWAAAGWGFGEIRMNDGDIPGRQKSDSIMRTGAAGGKLRLLSGTGSPSGGGATVDIKGEAWLTRLNIEDNNDRIEGITTDVNRLRLALQGAYDLPLGSGSSLEPSLEFGVRRDGGDGETGFGAELGGGISYFTPVRGLTVEMNGRGLLAHEGKAKDWGIGGAVRYDRGADRRGLSFSMLPSYGETSSGGVEHLWERGVTGRNADGLDPSFGLDTEVGYGFAALGGRGLLTPYGGVGPAYRDGRNYRLGSRLEIGRKFDLKLEGERLARETGESGHGLILSGRMNW